METRKRLGWLKSVVLVAGIAACGGSGNDGDRESIGFRMYALTAATAYGGLFMGSYFGNNYGVDVRPATSQSDGSKALNFELWMVPSIYQYNAYGYELAPVSRPAIFRSTPLCNTSAASGQIEVHRANRPTPVALTGTSRSCSPFATDTFVIGSDYRPSDLVPDYAVMAVHLDNSAGLSTSYRTSYGSCLSTTDPRLGPAPSGVCPTTAASSATSIDYYVYASPQANGTFGNLDAWNSSGYYLSNFIISGSADVSISTN